MGTRLWCTLATPMVALFLAGCADEPPPRSVEVSRTRWQNGTNNGAWPFTVDSGTLACHAPDWVTFTANGTEYALTDDARWLGHYQDVAAIQVASYVDIGTKRQPVPSPINPTMMDQGRALCPPAGALEATAMTHRRASAAMPSSSAAPR